MESSLNKYLEYLEVQRNYSKYTIISYEEDINLFFEYLQKECIDYLDVTYQDIRLFFNFLDEKKFSKSSIARKISSLRSYYNYLALNNYIKSNPFSLVKIPKKDQKLPKFLYYNELEQLFLIPDDTDLGIRDLLILELLYATGTRVGELEFIKLNDINLNDLSIKVLGKGNKERIVYYGEYAKKALDKYLKEARSNLLKDKKNEYLLLNNTGTRLTARGIRLILNKIIEKSSLDTKISPHTLRHTFATHLLNNGCDIISVQELLGHESLRATQIYTHITDEGLRNVYLKAHPRNKKKVDD